MRLAATSLCVTLLSGAMVSASNDDTVSPLPAEEALSLLSQSVADSQGGQAVTTFIERTFAATGCALSVDEFEAITAQAGFGPSQKGERLDFSTMTEKEIKRQTALLKARADQTTRHLSFWLTVNSMLSEGTLEMVGPNEQTIHSNGKGCA